MKIDRLIGILAVLLQQDRVTSPWLAEKFEVSRRTINRDIEDICKAGIPIVTVQGKNGGISIMEGYRIERTLLTSSDMQAILAGLGSLDSVSKTKRYQQLMDKFSSKESSALTVQNHMMINLSSWYKSSLAPQIELLQEALDRHERVSFTYFSAKGESERCLEPYLLVFQWSSWYIWGYCQDKADYRLFKLNRILNLTNTGQRFEPREHPEYEIEPDKAFPNSGTVEALFEPGMKWRLIEEYGVLSFTEQEDGRLLFSCGFSDKSNIFSWLLSCGDQVELLKPEELRREFLQLVKQVEQKYSF